MDQFASVFGKEGSLIRLDCRSLEYQYFPFKPEGYRLVLVDSVVKHELASSAYNKRRQSCEAAVAAIQKKQPHVKFLRDCTMEMLQEAKAEQAQDTYHKYPMPARRVFILSFSKHILYTLHYFFTQPGYLKSHFCHFSLIRT